MKELKKELERHFKKLRVGRFYSDRIAANESREMAKIDNAEKAVDIKKIEVIVIENTAMAMITAEDSSKLFYKESYFGTPKDRQTAAMIRVFNTTPEILRIFYKIKNKDPKALNHELFGEGMGNAVLPRFETKNCVESIILIFDKVGFNVRGEQGVTESSKTRKYTFVKKQAEERRLTENE